MAAVYSSDAMLETESGVVHLALDANENDSANMGPRRVARLIAGLGSFGYRLRHYLSLQDVVLLCVNLGFSILALVVTGCYARHALRRSESQQHEEEAQQIELVPRSDSAGDAMAAGFVQSDIIDPSEAL